MRYFEIKKDNRIIASNLERFKYLKEFKFGENKKININGIEIKSGSRIFENGSIWLIVEDEKDLIRCSKYFKATMEIYWNMPKDFFDYYVSKIKTYSHTLKNIQGQMKQRIESIISERIVLESYNFEDFKSRVREEIIRNEEEAARTLCDLNKRIFDFNAHIESFEVLTFGSKKDLNITNQNIKKVLLRIAQPFFEDFKLKDVVVKFHINDGYASERKVSFDYKTFNLAMYNFFDNAVKYTKPNSEINIYFTSEKKEFSIKFIMKSIRIEREELLKVFEQGYSGIHSREDAGDGIGMYVIQEALRINKMKMEIFPEYSNSENVEGKMYINNEFKITNL